MKKKNMLIVIIILVIGFASVSTSLIINGVVGIATNQDDFNIIFTSAKLDGKTRNNFIDSTKKKITFETNKLKTIDDESILDYEVTNTSRIYDGEVSISCVVPENEFVLVNYEPKNMIVEAGKTKTGNIKAKLIKSSVEDSNISITCTLSAKANERDTLGDEYVDPNKVGGTMMARSDNNKIWKSGIISNTTKIIFEKQLNPHETTEDLIFDVSEAQDKSVMAYVVKNDESTSSSEKYDIYIQSDGKIMANKNCRYLFENFYYLKTIEGIEYFDTSKVTDMAYMFSGDKFYGKNMNLTSLDVSHFDTSNVKDMSYMFDDIKLSTLNISNFDTSNVIEMTGMFSGCENFSVLDLSNFDTSKVIDMRGMFNSCSGLTTLDLSNFDTSNVTTMESMFWRCRNLLTLNISSFNTNKVATMSYMFRECNSLTTLDLSNFNTSNVKDMSYMFESCTSLTTLDLSSFDTSNVTDMEFMFKACTGFTSLNLSNFNTSKVTTMRELFNNCSNLTSLDISNFDISKLTGYFSKDYMFKSMPDNAIVKVKDETVQKWILNLNNKPSWNKSNIIVV